MIIYPKCIALLVRESKIIFGVYYSFLDRVTATIEDNLKALTPLLNLLTLTQPVAQLQQAVPISEEIDSAAEENMLEFLEGF